MSSIKLEGSGSFGGNRRSIRLKNYDYGKAGFYFITLVCKERRQLFGEIQNGIMCLNPYGWLAYNEWIKTEAIRPNISLGEFIIMPNHMHGIIQIDFSTAVNNWVGAFKSPSQSIGAIVRGYKGATTKQIKGIIYENESKQEEANELPAFDPKWLPEINLNQSIWQRDYFERIIWNEHAYQNISNYIINNPKNWPTP